MKITSSEFDSLVAFDHVESTYRWVIYLGICIPSEASNLHSK